MANIILDQYKKQQPTTQVTPFGNMNGMVGFPPPPNPLDPSAHMQDVTGFGRGAEAGGKGMQEVSHALATGRTARHFDGGGQEMQNGVDPAEQRVRDQWQTPAARANEMNNQGAGNQASSYAPHANMAPQGFSSLVSRDLPQIGAGGRLFDEIHYAPHDAQGTPMPRHGSIVGMGPTTASAMGASAAQGVGNNFGSLVAPSNPAQAPVAASGAIAHPTPPEQPQGTYNQAAQSGAAVRDAATTAAVGVGHDVGQGAQGVSGWLGGLLGHPVQALQDWAAAPDRAADAQRQAAQQAIRQKQIAGQEDPAARAALNDFIGKAFPPR